jgi:hypothetical protein
MISPLWRIFIRSMSVQIWTRSPTENCNMPPCNPLNDIDQHVFLRRLVVRNGSRAARRRIRMRGLGTLGPDSSTLPWTTYNLKKGKMWRFFYLNTQNEMCHGFKIFLAFIWNYSRIKYGRGRIWINIKPFRIRNSSRETIYRRA